MPFKLMISREHCLQTQNLYYIFRVKHRLPRSRIAPVRFSVTEWAAIQRAATAAGVTFSAYVRLAALERARPESVERTYDGDVPVNPLPEPKPGP